MPNLLDRLFGKSRPETNPAESQARHSGPRGTDDPRQEGRGPHDPVPLRHNEVLYALLCVLRGRMGKDRLEPISKVLTLAAYWGFDAPRIELMFAQSEPMIEAEDLAARLRGEFSPHDFEKTVSIISNYLGAQMMDGPALRVFADFAEVSGHGKDSLIRYLDEGLAMQRFQKNALGL